MDHDEFIVLQSAPAEQPSKEEEKDEAAAASPAREPPTPEPSSDQLLQPRGAQPARPPRPPRSRRGLTAARLGSACAAGCIAALAVLAMVVRPNLIPHPFASRPAQRDSASAQNDSASAPALAAARCQTAALQAELAEARAQNSALLAGLNRALALSSRYRDAHTKWTEHERECQRLTRETRRRLHVLDELTTDESKLAKTTGLALRTREAAFRQTCPLPAGEH